MSISQCAYNTKYSSIGWFETVFFYKHMIMSIVEVIRVLSNKSNNSNGTPQIRHTHTRIFVQFSWELQIFVLWIIWLCVCFGRLLFEIHLSDSLRFFDSAISEHSIVQLTAHLFGNIIYSVCVLITRRSAALFKNNSQREQTAYGFHFARRRLVFMDKISFCLAKFQKWHKQNVS